MNDDNVLVAVAKVREAYQEATTHPDFETWRSFYSDAWSTTCRMSVQYGRPYHVVADVIAALSPMKGWHENLRLAEEALKLTRGCKHEPALRRRLLNLKVMGSRRDAVVRALLGQGVSGPKVSAFAANIKGDMIKVTVDRHMHALTGLSKVDDAALAITTAAATLNEFPAVVQAATWGIHRNRKGYETYV